LSSNHTCLITFLSGFLSLVADSRDVEYEETESYLERVKELVVVEQMMKAHEINERREKMIKRDGKVAYKKTLRDRMKDSHAVHRFNESMKNERGNFESLAVLCETRLVECIAHTSLVEELPDEYRTAVVCDIMLKLTPIFGRYDALMTVLVKEVMRGIYGEVRWCGGIGCGGEIRCSDIFSN